jgi:hypothetical protein
VGRARSAERGGREGQVRGRPAGGGGGGGVGMWPRKDCPLSQNA